MGILLAGLCVMLSAGPAAKASEPAGTASDQTITSTTLMCALGGTSVRELPAADSGVLGELQEGETLYAVELADGWYRVVYHGETGYVEQGALAVFGSEDGQWDEPAWETMPPVEALTQPRQEEAENGTTPAEGSTDQENVQKEEQADASAGGPVQVATPGALEDSGQETSGVSSLTVLLLVAVAAVILGYGIGQGARRKEKPAPQEPEEDLAEESEENGSEVTGWEEDDQE